MMFPLGGVQSARHLIEGIGIVHLEADMRTILEILPQAGDQRMQVVSRTVTIAIRAAVVIRRGIEKPLLLDAAPGLDVRAQRTIGSASQGDLRLP